MALKVETRTDGLRERQVLAGMVYNRWVLGPIASRWEPNLFPSRHAQVIGQWCVEFFTKYGKPPGGGVVHLYREWCDSHPEPELIEMVGRLVAAVRDEYETVRKMVADPQVLVDYAAVIFNKHKLAELRNQIELCLEVGQEEKADALVARYRRVELGMGAGLSVFEADEEMSAALECQYEALLKLPGAIGEFMNRFLVRDSFVSFLAPEKRFKSRWLQYVTWAAVDQGLNVVYFECGDSSQQQLLLRLAVRLAHRPYAPGKYLYPTDIESQDDGDRTTMPLLKHEWREAKGVLKAKEVLTALHKKAADRPKRFRISCHPNSTLSVRGAEAFIDSWERDGYAPDCVIFDYADLLAPISNKLDRRDQIDETWRALRALSQKKHCLVLTATQATRESYDEWLLTREHVSEDKRKNAHVTGMIGINQTAAEKDKGLCRLNWVHGRDLDFGENKCLWCAGQIAVENPGIISCF